jgi:hypothetical protein
LICAGDLRMNISRTTVVWVMALVAIAVIAFKLLI